MTKLDPEDRMTPAERKAVCNLVDAWGRGDDEAASEYLKQVRFLPGSLLYFKETYGADYIRKHGYNTALADKHLGPGWLDA